MSNKFLALRGLIRKKLPRSSQEIDILSIHKAHLIMSLWQKLLQVLSIPGGKRNYELDRPLVDALQQLAEFEERPQEEVAADLLSAALEQRQVNETNLKIWRTLSTREQQVTALICLNYTNRQIATRLIISKDTVKSHVRNILRKFEVHSKAELRHILAKWDFSDWC
jgi:DNA-binding CsgD family transcriptional regulator